MTSSPAACSVRTIDLNSRTDPYADRLTEYRRSGAKYAERVVAPVVRQPCLHQVPVVDVVVHRQELDGRHAEPHQVLDRGLRGEPEVGAPQILGDAGVALGEPAHVQLVDDRLVPRALDGPVVAPRERRVDDRGQRRVRGVVAIVEAVRCADREAEHAVVPAHVPADRLGVGIEDQLGRVEPVALTQVVRPVDAVAIELAGPDLGEVPVPDLLGALPQRDAVRLFPRVGRVEQAQLDGRSVLGEQREVDADAIPGGAERVRGAWPDFHREARAASPGGDERRTSMPSAAQVVVCSARTRATTTRTAPGRPGGGPDPVGRHQPGVCPGVVPAGQLPVHGHLQHGGGGPDDPDERQARPGHSR